MRGYPTDEKSEGTIDDEMTADPIDVETNGDLIAEMNHELTIVARMTIMIDVQENTLRHPNRMDRRMIITHTNNRPNIHHNSTVDIINNHTIPTQKW
jgi:hypothetical protein